MCMTTGSAKAHRIFDWKDDLVQQFKISHVASIKVPKRDGKTDFMVRAVEHASNHRTTGPSEAA